MIKYDRDKVSRPAALDKTYGPGSQPPKKRGKTESKSILLALEEHIEKGEDPLDFRFPFERYKENEVRKALQTLFHGKCAYCESKYAATQPMDVEHWRPKKEVVEDKNKLPGYYWFAARWSNLYPSCIDCNRSRTQVDASTQEELVLGKANQFPVHEDTRLTSPEDPESREIPLLVDPCSDKPEDLFKYTEQGFILPAKDEGDEHDRALQSIRVYALNRADLVAERLARRRLVDYRFQLIRQLQLIRKDLDVPATDELYQLLSDLIDSETDALIAMMKDDRAYAGMVRQMIRDADPLRASTD